MAIPKHYRIGSGVTARPAQAIRLSHQGVARRLPEGSGVRATRHGGGGIAHRLPSGLKTSGGANEHKS